jgi:hypothetical protein
MLRYLIFKFEKHTFTDSDLDQTRNYGSGNANNSVTDRIRITIGLTNSLTLDINDVPNLVVLEVSGQMLHPPLLVGPREHVPRAATVALGVRHFLSEKQL